MKKSTPHYQIFEYSQGRVTYAVHVILDPKKFTVKTSRGQWHTEERPDKVKLERPDKVKFDDLDSASLFFRSQLALYHANGHPLVRGEAVAIDPEEDYKSVKEKTRHYLYLENPDTNQFWDIDLDCHQVIMWQGEIGKKGSETIEECDWDGDAKERHYDLVEEKKAKGFAEAGAEMAAAFLLEFGDEELAPELREFFASGRHQSYQHHKLLSIGYCPGPVFVDFENIESLENPEFVEDTLGEGYLEFANLTDNLETDPEGDDFSPHLGIHMQTMEVYLMEPSGDPELIADGLEAFLALLRQD